MLDIKILDPYVLNILKEHGWYQDRRYDISDWLNTLSSEGYTSFEYAETILKSLGGIYVNVVGDKEHMGAQFNFDPLYAGGHYVLLSKFEDVAEEELYPLGEMVQALAYVGKSKKIYWGDWKNLYLAGDFIEDYLNNLFDKKNKPKLLYSNTNADEEIKAVNDMLRLKFPDIIF
jgi:hypothetical protein